VVLTFFDAVLVRALVVRVLLLGCDTLDALIEMVLVANALG
jgi:hypothetical protein